MKRFTALQRFEMFALKIPFVECWIWSGKIDEEGYGYFFGDDSRPHMAHRAAYEMFVAKIPDGLTIDHLCRVRCCVRPDHLEPVTMRENTLRGNAPSARQAKQTHCLRGHPFDATNTYRSPYQKVRRRYCRACVRQRDSLRRRRLVVGTQLAKD